MYSANEKSQLKPGENALNGDISSMGFLSPFRGDGPKPIAFRTAHQCPATDQICSNCTACRGEEAMPACLSLSEPAEALAFGANWVMILLATTRWPVGLTPCNAITWPGNRRYDWSLETSRATLSPWTTYMLIWYSAVRQCLEAGVFFHQNCSHSSCKAIGGCPYGEIGAYLMNMENLECKFTKL